MLPPSGPWDVQTFSPAAVNAAKPIRKSAAACGVYRALLTMFLFEEISGGRPSRQAAFRSAIDQETETSALRSCARIALNTRSTVNDETALRRLRLRLGHPRGPPGRRACGNLAEGFRPARAPDR